jgi:hypothetical protein
MPDTARAHIQNAYGPALTYSNACRKSWRNKRLNARLMLPAGAGATVFMPPNRVLMSMR